MIHEQFSQLKIGILISTLLLWVPLGLSLLLGIFGGILLYRYKKQETEFKRNNPLLVSMQ